uniref:DUF4158 domain-containing protein n=1 Tax=Nocardiopsis ganjiahuensis TaxID=239984 RepID=UPI000346A7DD|nr:DUF4158 domain-containing protein [Nocardiopsis ganjiahuensis]
MRQDRSPEQLVDEWTLEEGDRKLLGNKSGATRLGFALKLKFFQIEGRFPSYAEEIPAAAVDFVADQVGVEAALFGKYPWNTRSVKYHRSQIRDKYGTHAATEEEEDQLADWLADQVCPVEVDRDELAQAVVRRCRTLKIEPARGAGRADRRLRGTQVRGDLHHQRDDPPGSGHLRPAPEPGAGHRGRAGGREVRSGPAGAGNPADRD